MRYNEIRIRQVDAAAVAKIDELAQKKGMSRNRYLKMYIENLAIIGELKLQEEKYKNLVSAVSDVIDHNTAELEKMRNQIENLMPNKQVFK